MSPGPRPMFSPPSTVSPLDDAAVLQSAARMQRNVRGPSYPSDPTDANFTGLAKPIASAATWQQRGSFPPRGGFTDDDEMIT